jgi:hypothetical protein
LAKDTLALGFWRSPERLMTSKLSLDRWHKHAEVQPVECML